MLPYLLNNEDIVPAEGSPVPVGDFTVKANNKTQKI